MLSSDPVALHDCLVLYLVLRVLDHSCLVQSRSQFIGQKLIAAQPVKTKQFVLHDSVDEEAKSRQGADVEFLHKEGCLFSLDGKELRLGKLLGKDTEVFVHDGASLELFVEEVDDCELEFGDVVEELILCDLHIARCIPLCTRRQCGSPHDD